MPAHPGRAGRSPDSSADRARQQLRELLTPVVGDAGLELDDVTVSKAGRRSLVRVVVDAEGGVDLDAVAVVSRAASAALDAAAPGGAAFAGPYVLEVTSPGVDRPLTEPRHWRRAVGRLVRVPVDGMELTGRVAAAGEAGVELHAVDAGETRDAVRHIEWGRLGRGRVQVEFSRADLTGSEQAEE